MDKELKAQRSLMEMDVDFGFTSLQDTFSTGRVMLSMIYSITLIKELMVLKDFSLKSMLFEIYR